MLLFHYEVAKVSRRSSDKLLRSVHASTGASTNLLIVVYILIHLWKMKLYIPMYIYAYNYCTGIYRPFEGSWSLYNFSFSKFLIQKIGLVMTVGNVSSLKRVTFLNIFRIFLVDFLNGEPFKYIVRWDKEDRYSVDSWFEWQKGAAANALDSFKRSFQGCFGFH